MTYLKKLESAEEMDIISAIKKAEDLSEKYGAKFYIARKSTIPTTPGSDYPGCKFDIGDGHKSITLSLSYNKTATPRWQPSAAELIAEDWFVCPLVEDGSKDFFEESTRGVRG